MGKETVQHKWEEKRCLADSCPLAEVVLVSQLNSWGIKREITSTTSLHQDCINDLRWEASGHREPKSFEECKRKVRSTYELRKLNEEFIATALLFFSLFPCCTSTPFSLLLSQLEMEAKQGLQHSRNLSCCCQQ